MWIVGAIILLIVFVCALMFLRFLLTSYVITRIVSVGSEIVSLIMALACDREDEKTMVICCCLSILSWLAFISPIVFGAEWDGTFTLDWDSDPFTLGEVLALLINFVFAFFIIGAAYSLITSVAFFLVPIVMILINVIFVIRMRNY